ncbi:MAG: hypothetical protein QOE03_2242 [Micromonosporaceae bacterium]|nr:hypothetical protein [Micromonosporaceae bacterium]
MSYQFKAPPGWPVPTANWTPPNGWQPDPLWPPAPAEWQFWVAATDQAPRPGAPESPSSQYRNFAPPVSKPSIGESPDTVLHWILPTGRSWQSIASGYVALFAWLIWPLGPVALVLGVWALVRASRDGSHGKGRAVFAVVIGVPATVMLIVALNVVLRTR